MAFPRKSQGGPGGRCRASAEETKGAAGEPERGAGGGLGGHAGDLGGLAYSPAYTHICITVFANLVRVLGDVGVAGGSGPVGAGP